MHRPAAEHLAGPAAHHGGAVAHRDPDRPQLHPRCRGRDAAGDEPDAAVQGLRGVDHPDEQAELQPAAPLLGHHRLAVRPGRHLHLWRPDPARRRHRQLLRRHQRQRPGARSHADGEHSISPVFGFMCDTGEHEVAEEDTPIIRLGAQRSPRTASAGASTAAAWATSRSPPRAGPACGAS